MMFLTMKEYLLGARKLLALYGYNCLKNDEDAISYVASYMMKADHTWDGSKSSRDTWRFNQAKFAIMKLKTAHRKKRKLRSLEDSIGSNNSPHPIYLKDVIEDPKNNQCDVVQTATDIMEYAQKQLHPRQFQCLQMYYYGKMTLQQIGDELGVSRERVRQILSNGLSKLKHEYKSEFDSITS